MRRLVKIKTYGEQIGMGWSEQNQTALSLDFSESSILEMVSGVPG